MEVLIELCNMVAQRTWPNYFRSILDLKLAALTLTLTLSSLFPHHMLRFLKWDPNLSALGSLRQSCECYMETR